MTTPPAGPREQRLVFGEVAELYHRTRPGYPSELVQAVVAATGVAAPRAVEIGAGTGKATVLLAPLCSSLVVVEPSEPMAAIAAAQIGDAGHVSVVTATFEAWQPDDATEQLDLVVSAQAWHWVDHTVGLPKVGALLRPGGVFAVFWNRPLPPVGAINAAVQGVYDSVAPDLPVKRPWEFTLRDDVARLRAAPWVDTVDEAVFAHAVTYTTAEYLDLMRTQSDHRMMDEARHDRLLAGLQHVIDEHGGNIRIGYEARLVMAHRV